MNTPLERLLSIVEEAVGQHPDCAGKSGKRWCRWCDMRDALQEVHRERKRP